MKKKLIIIFSVIIALIVAFVLGLYFLSRPVSKNKDEVTFVVEAGANKIEIVSSLKDAGVIRSKITGLVYVFFTPNVNLQAGTYIIDKSNSTKEIINQIATGTTNEKVVTVSITFVEGKKFTDYAKLISNNFNITYDEIIAKGEDEEFLKSLIDKYWFIDEDILSSNLYFPLEGYLYPNTYDFYQDTSIESIFYTMLDEMDKVLTPLKDKINEQEYNVHELLTIASIAEKEALNKSDREKVSQVIYTRLDMGMTLGMDVTTYYGVFKDMTDNLTPQDLAAFNPYNTRNSSFKGLPAGAICSPSKESIVAALNPSDTDYVYFIADVKTGKVYFAVTPKEFYELKDKYID